MIIDITPRLPYRASPELMEIWRARVREILKPQEPAQRPAEATKEKPGGSDTIPAKRAPT